MKKMILSLVLLTSAVYATEQLSLTKKPIEKEFYIYTERGSRLNHYIPSGWMGDYGDLKLNPGVKEKPKGGETCLQIKYSAERKQGAGWCGIYWQTPANNWGDKKGGYDLAKYKTLKFFARGEKGGEMIDKFMIGGITGQTEEGDSDENSIEAIELTKEWKEYEIKLVGLDLSHIVGGFGFAVNGDINPQGMTFYLDEIRLEQGK